MTTNPRSTDYKGWSREQLIERLLALEGPRSVNAPIPSPSLPSPATPENRDRDQNTVPTTPNTGIIRSVSAKEFNFSNHAKRKIALKFCYSGWEYCGLAYQNGVTQLPTVEGVLFEALAKARLIDPEGGMEGCGWEKCGRTDKGVSAAGQVISLWVRSAVGSVEKEKMVEEVKEEEQKDKEEEVTVGEDSGLPGLGEDDFGTLDLSESSSPSPTLEQSSDEASKPKHELDYIAILNRLLPPTIRVLAWAPVAPSFSARFSCKYRHYKYFFSSHSLDISAMREAATRLVGEHDFRNLCKVDAQKQITMFRRTIWRAEIEPVDGDSAGGGDIERGEGMYVFNLVGNAFLYHQVRHIMAILFLIGTGLEKPSLVTKLMNVAEGAENYGDGGSEEPLEVVDRRPEYQMADALPLMLWDCGYAEEDVKWRTGTLEPDADRVSTENNIDARRSGSGTETDLYHQLHSIWTRSRIYTVLDRHFLQAAEKYHRPPYSPLPIPPSSSTSTSALVSDSSVSINYPVGGGAYRRALKYVPVLERNRLDTIEMINERWRVGKGSRRAERKNAGMEQVVDDGDE